MNFSRSPMRVKMTGLAIGMLVACGTSVVPTQAAAEQPTPRTPTCDSPGRPGSYVQFPTKVRLVKPAKVAGVQVLGMSGVKLIADGGFYEKTDTLEVQFTSTVRNSNETAIEGRIEAMVGASGGLGPFAEVKGEITTSVGLNSTWQTGYEQFAGTTKSTEIAEGVRNSSGKARTYVYVIGNRYLTKATFEVTGWRAAFTDQIGTCYRKVVFNVFPTLVTSQDSGWWTCGDDPNKQAGGDPRLWRVAEKRCKGTA